MESVLDNYFSNKPPPNHLVKCQCFRKQSIRLKNIYHTYNSVEELFALLIFSRKETKYEKIWRDIRLT